MKKILAIVLAMVMCFSLLAACGSKDTGAADTGSTNTGSGTTSTGSAGTTDTTKEEKYVETVTIAYASDLPDFFPANNSGTQVTIAANMTHDDLMWYNPDDGSLNPKLATEITGNDASTVFTIKLREGVTSHDGKPLTADDLIFTMDMIVDGTQVKFPSSELSAVYSAGNAKKVDDLTVEITLDKPSVDFTYVAAGIRVYSKEAFESGMENPGYIGFGPMKYHSNTVGVEYKLERHEDYYEGARKTKYIVVKTMPEISSQLAALQAGEINWYGSMSTADIPIFEEDENIDYVLPNGTTVYAMMWNGNSKYAQDKYVRDAVAMSIDKEAVNVAMFDGLGAPTHNIAGNATSPDFVEIANPFPYDVAKAKETLAKSSFKPEEIELTIMYYAWNKPIAEMIQFCVEELGVKTKMSEIDGSVFRAAAEEGNYDITMTYFGLASTINNWPYKLYRAEGANNYYGYPGNPEIDALMDKYAKEATTKEKALAISAEIQEACANDSHYLPLVMNVNTVPFTSKLQGIQPYGISFNDLSTIYIVEE